MCISFKTSSESFSLVCVRSTNHIWVNIFSRESCDVIEQIWLVIWWLSLQFNILQMYIHTYVSTHTFFHVVFFLCPVYKFLLQNWLRCLSSAHTSDGLYCSAWAIFTVFCGWNSFMWRLGYQGTFNMHHSLLFIYLFQVLSSGFYF